MEEKRRIHVFEKVEGLPVRYLYHGAWKILGFRQVAMEPRGKLAFRFMIGENNERWPSSLAVEPMFALDDVAADIQEPPARYLALTHRSFETRESLNS